MLKMESCWLERRDNPLYNTSYPLRPEDWRGYRSRGELPFPEKRCAFYIHIPFCRQICTFCEYTRMQVPSESEQLMYLETLSRDIGKFLQQHPGLLLYGFDIGGGTPTILSGQAFSKLLALYRYTRDQARTEPCFEPSIEGTFSSISEDKASAMAQAGIHRLSLGLQSSCESVLARHNRREVERQVMQEKMVMIRSCGISKVNLDLMYGLRGQSSAGIAADLEMLAALKPDHVTLYEWRTNMLHRRPATSARENYLAYEQYYAGLTRLGYTADFGQNTFSLHAGDMGCSSYLRLRMTEGAAYKGFGISAQSMSSSGISYNYGKNAARFRLDPASYEQGDVYLLPPAELSAKYISIAAYCGRISLSGLSEILQQDAEKYFEQQIDFVLSRGLMERERDILRVTRKGFLHYGATFSLFSSPPV